MRQKKRLKMKARRAIAPHAALLRRKRTEQIRLELLAALGVSVVVGACEQGEVPVEGGSGAGGAEMSLRDLRPPLDIGGGAGGMTDDAKRWPSVAGSMMPRSHRMCVESCA